MPKLKIYLINKIKAFKGGCISSKIQEWQNITSDEEILKTVEGLTLDFEQEPPSQKTNVMSGQASQKGMVEINKLVGKGVIEYTEHEEGEFISPIFFRSKSDGTSRLILNLKILNEFLEYNHFKMETVNSVVDLIQPHCYMTSIDLKDAYYSVKISEEDTKYLKFYVGKNFKFVVLPNGLCSGPRKFTKLTKPPIACLRIEGVIVAIYIDDIIAIGDTYEKCLIGTIKTIKLFLKLGFIIHPEKSSLQPSQEITYLGFVFNSKEMLVTLTRKKGKKFLSLAKNF